MDFRNRTILMRVLVTGGAGYIGSHTARSLMLANHDPIILDNLTNGNEWIVKDVLKVPLIKGSIGDKKLIESLISGKHKDLIGTIHENKRIEGVLHFAAYAYVGESMQKPFRYYLNNVCETIKMLEVICKNNTSKEDKDSEIPLVFSSSCATYGIPNIIPIRENMAQNPISPYGKSKLIIEGILKDLAKAYGFRSVILRYFNAAGASPLGELGELHDPETHLIPLAIEAVLEKRGKLKVFGNNYDTHDGTCIRDYIHVCDLADAHVLALDYLKNSKKTAQSSKDTCCNEFNLGNGKGISVKEIISAIEKIANKKVPVSFVERRAGDPAVLVASSEKAKKILGWKPKYENIDLIVKHAYNWHSILKNNCELKNEK
jgi:UDP-glucose 4-epimerase